MIAQIDSVVEIVNPQAAVPLLIVCDHASNRIPAELADLGLPAAELGRHIAWDIGAAIVARQLARRLAATAVLSGVSRLVIDCNRPVGHPTSICPVSDGTVVPGNENLDAASAADRAAAYFHPYHAAIHAQLERLESSAATAAVVAIHSFTPVMGGRARPWRAGILWNRDPRLALPLMEALRRECGDCIGDNEPYSGRDCNYTVDVHGGEQGRPHVSIEIRQDELGDEKSAVVWGDRLALLLEPLLAQPVNRCRETFGPGRLAGAFA